MYVGRSVPGWTRACPGNWEAWIPVLVPALHVAHCGLEQIYFAIWALLSPNGNGRVMVDVFFIYRYGQALYTQTNANYINALKIDLGK